MTCWNVNAGKKLIISTLQPKYRSKRTKATACFKWHLKIDKYTNKKKRCKAKKNPKNYRKVIATIYLWLLSTATENVFLCLMLR